VRLAAHTFAFRELPLPSALDRLLSLGFRDVEVWLGHGRAGPDATAEAVRSSGARACAVSAGGFYSLGDDAPARAFALARALEVDVVVACLAPEIVADVVDLVPPDVRLAVENHWYQRLAHSREVRTAIRGNALAACLDTGHALAAGERPERFARRLGPRIGHVHLKEGRLPSLHERVLGRRLRRRLLPKPAIDFPGAGDLDVGALRRMLAEIGFTGWITVEHEGDDPENALTTLARLWHDAE
jgi:sugar phosphate isomerase/epimerase